MSGFIGFCLVITSFIVVLLTTQSVLFIVFVLGWAVTLLMLDVRCKDAESQADYWRERFMEDRLR